MKKLILGVLCVSSLALADSVSGTATVNNNDLEPGTNSLRVGGKAAEKLYKDLQVKEEITQTGTFTASTKGGEQIFCKLLATPGSSEYSCAFVINNNDGKVNDAK